ncbi:MAG TPA: carboxymuconolactone decarboxylase family protein, partial [Dehalococcoidia bacterium]
DGTVPNIFRALGNSPTTLRNFMRLGNSILRHLKLSPRLRELAILRVASLTGSAYEWAHHVPLAREAGISEEALYQIGQWRRSLAFDAQESAVLALAEASTLDVQVPDEVFRRVREFLDEEEVVELLMTIGYYNLVARLLVGLKVDVEPGYQQWSLPPDDLRPERR